MEISKYFSYVCVVFGSCFSICSSSSSELIYYDENESAESSQTSFSDSISSSARSSWTYDVFLSFRGEDTRNNFVDHLYTALVHRGIRTFKDDQKLKWGDTISKKLLKAIEESRCAVVILSQNYASSSWCLEEVTKFIECQRRKGQRVLPVFYNVEPSDFRWQKNSFETSFRQHLVNYRDETEKVNKWREALTDASQLAGCHVATTANRHESECIKQIVAEILYHTSTTSTHLGENLIGMESHVQQLMSLMCMESAKDIRVIGIYGMGGIGKTTIARALFQEISNKFEGSSFLKDVRETGFDDNGLRSLQEKIITDILMDKNINVSNCYDGVRKIQKSLNDKKILLVIDNVDEVKQLESLAAPCDWFGEGSRIIITTRDEHLLSNANYKYKPALLEKDQAIELFNRHAFEKVSLSEEYKELTSRIISYACGLPLALKVLGSFFHGRKICTWVSALNGLDKELPIEIFKTLKLSFNGLEVSEKEIFLEIACFFDGKDKEYVIKILESFGFDAKLGIDILIEKSLLTLSGKNLSMHNLIQIMGQQIVSQNLFHSRLWEFDY